MTDKMHTCHSFPFLGFLNKLTINYRKALKTITYLTELYQISYKNIIYVTTERSAVSYHSGLDRKTNNIPPEDIQDAIIQME